MTTTTHTPISTHRSGPRAGTSWARAVDALRTRRQAHSRRRQLQRQLADYRTATEVDDLLEMLRHHDGPDADVMRTQLVNNRLAYAAAQRPVFIAS